MSDAGAYRSHGLEKRLRYIVAAEGHCISGTRLQFDLYRLGVLLAQFTLEPDVVSKNLELCVWPARLCHYRLKRNIRFRNRYATLIHRRVLLQCQYGFLDLCDDVVDLASKLARLNVLLIPGLLCRRHTRSFYSDRLH